MKKCKNTECEKFIEEKRTYCSLKCRNIFVNKNLRDYSKNGDALKKKAIVEYEKVKRFCLECNKELLYEKKDNENFCNRSCAAKYTNSRRVISYTDTAILNKKRSAIKNFKIDYDELKQKREEYYNNPLICEYCESVISYETKIKNKKRKFCNNSCRFNSNRKNMSNYQIYKSECQFKFALNDYIEEFDFNLIKENGWYKAKNRGNNLNGVSRDHLFSISEGFKQNVSAEIISHPANCKLVVHSKNQKKNTKCDVTLEELKKRIEEWNNKYGRVAQLE